MAKTKYNEVYMTPRERAEDGAYGSQGLPPSENTLIKEFDRSGNTIRRAIGQLALEGYMQDIHSKGVRIIYRPEQQQSEFILGGIENLKEAVAGNRKNYTTGVICFVELAVDKTIQRRTTLPVGIQICYIQRVRCTKGGALITDHNYFLKGVVRDLTPEIAGRSTYEYIGKNLGESTMTTKKKMTMECVDQIDETYLDSKDYNCMAVVSSMAYNKEGVMFEFIQSRYRPNRFVFYDLAHRTKQANQGTGEQGASSKCSFGAFWVRGVKDIGKS